MPSCENEMGFWSFDSELLSHEGTLMSESKGKKRCQCAITPARNRSCDCRMPDL